MPFRIGLSGLNAAEADLKVTGNNIANTATTGFKESRAEFADVFAQAYGGISKTAIGSGVRLAATTQQFSQGNIEYTENALDLAINGEGFFVLDDDGARVFSRAGAFEVDRDGFVVNSEGKKLQVYTPVTEGVSETNFNTGEVSALQLDFSDKAPLATSEVNTDMNLRSDAEQLLDASGNPYDPIDTTDPETYNYATSITLYDSLGTPRTTTFYFSKQANAGEWTIYTEIEGALDDASGNQLIMETDATFDSNGILEGLDGNAGILGVTWPPTGTTVSFENGATIGDDPTGGDAPVITFDFSDITQYGTKYSVSDLSQDGYTTGRLNGFDVDQSGVVFARYTNGQSAALGKVVLADFKNPQGLQQLGDNCWAETYAAGDPIYGDPGTSSLGLIQSGGLEASNVDLSEELVNLITAQRNFQANAKTISTADEITQTIINIG